MAKKSTNNDVTYVLDSKVALPNKLLQSDGSITDLNGNVVVNPVDSYKNKLALPNKFLNPDGTYSTLNEIISSIDSELFIIVDELPASGDEQKIYLVPDDSGGFVEYHWTGTAWDAIGTVDIDLSNYSTTQEMMNAIEAAALQTLNAAKAYTDAHSVTFKPYPASFVTDGTTQQFLNSIIGSNLAVGMAYLGQVSLSDMPDGVTVQAEVEVYIYPQNVAYCIMRSAEVSPYIWEVNSYENRGWEPIDKTAKDYADANFIKNISEQGVFFWDGQSSSSVSSNLQLWKDIINCAKTHITLVIVGDNSTSYNDQDKSVIIISPADVSDVSSSSKTFYALPTAITVNTTTSGNDQGSTYGVKRGYVSVSFSNGEVSALGGFTITDNESRKYLPTDVNTITSYTPTYDYHPATKKYVDDSIANNITSALTDSY